MTFNALIPTLLSIILFIVFIFMVNEIRTIIRLVKMESIRPSITWGLSGYGYTHSVEVVDDRGVITNHAVRLKNPNHCLRDRVEAIQAYAEASGCKVKTVIIEGRGYLIDRDSRRYFVNSVFA